MFRERSGRGDFGQLIHPQPWKKPASHVRCGGATANFQGALERRGVKEKASRGRAPGLHKRHLCMKAEMSGQQTPAEERRSEKTSDHSSGTVHAGHGLRAEHTMKQAAPANHVASHGRHSAHRLHAALHQFASTTASGR